MAVFDNLHQGVLILDADHRVRAFNALFPQLLGFPIGSLRAGCSAGDVVALAHAGGHYGALSLETAQALWRQRLEARTSSQHRTPLSSGDTVNVAYAPAPDGGWVITCEDITERLSTAAALAAQNERFDAALTNMPHGLCLFDRERRLIFCNEAYRRLYDLPEGLVRAGTHLSEILAHRTRIGNAPVDMGRYFDVTVEARRRNNHASALIALGDGRTIRITHNPTSNGYVALHEDVTASVRAEEAVEHLGTHDALTGLPNRAVLRDRLGAAAGAASTCETAPFAVHCLDLDDFKIVNDTLGHAAGDRLLQAVAARIAAVLDTDCFFARLGGDEFVVLQRACGTGAEVERLARSIIRAVAAPFPLDGHDASVGVSIGTAICPADGDTGDDLLKRADVALYRAKAAGRNEFRLFEAVMDRELQSRRALEADLRRAVSDGGFALHYQPQVDARRGTIRGFEALLRWQHPTRGAVPPLHFIPVAEEMGLIGPLGTWALRQACRDAAAWPAEVSVAVNLSALQFRDGTLPDIVAAALKDAGLAPSRLELEITESVLLVDSAATLATLKRLKAIGVRIALDDFGTGYSSLSYLRAFAFDRIKIDRSFIQDLGDQKGATVIVGAVVGLGTALGIAVTAEGVETETQLARVVAHGCHEIQGYLFSKPRPVSEVPDLLARGAFGGAEAEPRAAAA